MATPTLNDFLTALNNFTGDATTGGTTEQRRKIWAINLAKDYLLSLVGLPASEVTTPISYLDDQNKYVLPVGISEPISLRYDEAQGQADVNKANNARRKWEFMRSDELYLYQDLQASDIVYFGIDYANNSNQVVIITDNIVPSFQISAADDTTEWATLGDASALAVDNSVYKEGLGSLSFTITYSSGKAIVQFSLGTPTDYTNYLSTGVFSFDLFVQILTGLNAVAVQIGSDAPGGTLSNYWKMSTTTQADGSAFAASVWNSLSTNWANATMTGSPNITQIQYVQIEIDIANTFPTTTLWRIDDLELHNPDAMLFKYYTDQIVQDASSGLMKKDFVANGDKASFASIDQSIVNVVAAIAAGVYRPTSLNQDGSVANAIAKQGIANLQYRFPKKTLDLMERLRTVTRSS